MQIIGPSNLAIVCDGILNMTKMTHSTQTLKRKNLFKVLLFGSKYHTKFSIGYRDISKYISSFIAEFLL